MTLEQLVEKMSRSPAAIAKVTGGEIKEGAPADIVMVDGGQWKVEAKKFLSRGKNTPLDGKTLYGRVLMTFNDGRMVYKREEV